VITIFSTPKPFAGHEKIIQLNAISSWKKLNPNIEIIIFGNEEGCSEVCETLNIIHVPYVEKNKFGTKYLNYIFNKAQQIAKYNYVCYINCDIILTADFIKALKETIKWNNEFLAIGQRWDIDIQKFIDFNSNWDEILLEQTLKNGIQKPCNWIDYFVFNKGLYLDKLLPFLIGRPSWDNWLIWKARNLNVPVVDFSKVVIALHQNHDYSYHKDGEKGVWFGEESQYNRELLGHWSHFHTIKNSTHFLTYKGFSYNYFRYFNENYRTVKLEIRDAINKLLNLTRPLRNKVNFKR